ncbi:DoxX family protein [Sulfitobacter sp.]|jgi:putative oxidoreductase|uniref:DoxX family protein n=1 Tax=Sulfitobacter sp. TaxID=1903071 RepID=UPI000C3CBEEE|nr:DoxX protein [Roseobacter sp.]MBV48853.1 DoxX protein [Roseobacter sp.]|tara:strand:+ start:578 stop:946 length:369 start_codon:yes stop_codon:yes gene_type:complete
MKASVSDVALTLGRWLLASLFFAGFLQKLIDPSAAQALLASWYLPGALVWPAMVFNGVAAFMLVTGIWVAQVSFALALYCMFTSIFHLIPSDPWQMSIFVKNWAIAGGLLVLAGHAWERRRC